MREVAREGRLWRVYAPDRDRRHLGALGAIERCGAVTEPALHESVVAEHAAAVRLPNDLEAPGGGASQGGDRDQEDERPRQVVQRVACEAPGGNARKQYGLREDQEGRKNP